MSNETLLHLLAAAVVISPAVLFAVLGVAALAGRRLSESLIARLTFAAVITGLTCAVCVLAFMLISGSRHVVLSFGNWVEIAHGDGHMHFALKFVFDRLSVPFTILTYVLCGVVSAFGNSYLHREAGYRRFFLFFAIFLLGMVVSSLAGTIETMFAGWEFVGLSSALLVAFYQERPGPVRNGLRVWSVYRISDAAFLLAAVALHHMTGQGDFDSLMGSGPWPLGVANVSPNLGLIVGLLLLIAAAGKSALLPFSDWLPRAMEGPTPSSAIFYGALSVHLGAFLLLRVGPLLETSPWFAAAVVAVGLSTAVFAAIVGRVQTDVKTALAYASLVQVGIIVAEIGFGFRYLPLVHILGHSFVRTLQFLRAPNVLREYRLLENAAGPVAIAGSMADPSHWQLRMYHFALERGTLDALTTALVIRPFFAFFSACDRIERRWTDWLTGAESRESDLAPIDEPLLREAS